MRYFLLLPSKAYHQSTIWLHTKHCSKVTVSLKSAVQAASQTIFCYIVMFFRLTSRDAVDTIRSWNRGVVSGESRVASKQGLHTIQAKLDETGSTLIQPKRKTIANTLQSETFGSPGIW